MAYVLEQHRACDGSCCRESPRFPNSDKSDCLYREPGSLSEGCRIMRGLDAAPALCPVVDGMTGHEAYVKTCLNYPQNTSPGRDLGDCCWRWVNNGN